MLTDRVRALDNPRYTVSALLAAIHVVGVAGLPIVLSIGRPRFMAFYLIAVGSLLCFDLLLVTRLYPNERIDVTQYVRRFATVRLVCVLLLACLSLFLLDGQSVVLLLLLSLAIFLNIIVLGDAERSRESAVSLGTMAALSFLLTASETTKGVLFTGSSDTIGHLDNIYGIVQTGSLLNLPSARLASVPLTHIAAAEAVVVTGGEVYVSAIMYHQLAVCSAILFTYVTVRNLTTRHTAAIAAGVIAALPTLVSAGSRLHYQTFSFVLSCLFIMLALGLYKTRPDKLLLVTVGAWAFTHHVSLLLSLPFIVTVFLVYGKHDSDVYPNYPAILALSLLFSYIFYREDFLFEVVNWIFVANPPGSAPGGYQITYYDNLVTLAGSAISDFLSYIYYIPLTAIPATGVVAGLFSKLGVREMNRRELYLLVGTAPAFVLFVPTPLWMLLEGTGQLSRWFSVLTPFMIISAAITTRYFVKRGFHSSSRSNANLAVLLLITLLVLSAPNTGDLNGIAGYEGEPQRHITNSEMEAIDHVVTYLDEGQVHSYTHIPRYLGTEMVGADGVSPRRLIRVQLTEPQGLPSGLSILSSERLSESLVTIRKCVERDLSRACSGFATISVDAETAGAGSSKTYANGETAVYWVP